MNSIEYKGYFIEELYGLITVFVMGEELVFDSVQEAKAEINNWLA